MTSSLVGSEMCIRDRSKSLRKYSQRMLVPLLKRPKMQTTCRPISFLKYWNRRGVTPRWSSTGTLRIEKHGQHDAAAEA
eukprot:7642390-Prorocentrum_lima.AAC.1